MDVKCISSPLFVHWHQTVFTPWDPVLGKQFYSICDSEFIPVLPLKVGVQASPNLSLREERGNNYLQFIVLQILEILEGFQSNINDLYYQK